MINFMQTVQKGAQFMKRHNKSAILVTRSDDSVKGIVTERDITRRLVAVGKNAEQTYLEDIMTTTPQMLFPNSRVRDVLKFMREKNYRHMPVADDSMVYGIVSIRDIYSCLSRLLQTQKKTPSFVQAWKKPFLSLATMNSNLIFLPPGATVLEAARLMLDKKVGAILIMKSSKLRGIITERDVAFKVIAEGLCPETTILSQVRTKHLHTVGMEASSEGILQLMEANNCRHIPIMDGDKVNRVVSMKDVDEFLQDYMEAGFSGSRILRVLNKTMKHLWFKPKLKTH